MTTSQRNTLTELCENERIQFLTILSLLQTNFFMAGYLLTGNKSNFVQTEGDALWLYECKHYVLTLYLHKEICFDNIPIHHQDTIYYVNPISHQTYSFATEFTCDGNPTNIIGIDLGGNEYYLLTPTPLKRPSCPFYFFNSSRYYSTKHSSAHTAGLYSGKQINASGIEFVDKVF